MNNLITLNLGCGDRTYNEYPENHRCINYDIRPELEHVDQIGSVEQLPYSDNSINYILASDIIEHFPIAKTKGILNEWKRVLVEDGIIEFRMPNLEEICKRYLDKSHTAEKTSWLLYGGQNYPGNFHYVAFDHDWFKDIIKSIGFNEISYEESGNNFIIKIQKVLASK